MLRAAAAALLLFGLAGCIPPGKPGEPGSSGHYQQEISRSWNERTHEASVRMKLDLSKLDISCGVGELEVGPLPVGYDDVNGAKADQALFDALMRKFDEAALAEPSAERQVCLGKLKARMQTVLQSCPLPFAPCAFSNVQASHR